jgi:hypothetical protein
MKNKHIHGEQFIFNAEIEKLHKGE